VGSWPLARATAKRLISSVERFLSVEASSGILLLAAAVLSIGINRIVVTDGSFRPCQS